MDFSLLNYVSTMEIEQNSNTRFKYVAPGTVAAANVSEILVPKGSPIASLADLKGKKIGSPQTTGAIGNLAVETTLKAHGVDPRDVTFVATVPGRADRAGPSPGRCGVGDRAVRHGDQEDAGRARTGRHDGRDHVRGHVVRHVPPPC
jgi:hypothetical protein